MIFSIVLVVAYALMWAVTRGQWHARRQWRNALGIGMVVAGLTHFLTPLPFVQHLPEWVPARYAIIYATGVAEMALGVWAVSAPPRAIPVVGAALAAYLFAVFPANVYVAVAGVDVSGQPGGIYPWLRLPFQALFVWLALWSTGADAWVSKIRLSRRPLPFPGARARGQT